MPRPALTSRSPRRTPAPATPAVPAAAVPAVASPRLKAWFRPALRWSVAGAVAGALTVAALLTPWSAPQRITQEDIDRAVRLSLEKEPLPSAAAAAYEAVLPSVVRVLGLKDDDDGGSEGDDSDDDGALPEKRALERSLGTGVVIIDNGTILTNLHVVSGARKIMVRFADGSDSQADLIGSQPQNDLAVLRARQVPDDLAAATMRSTGDLRPGDHVIAVGHPFGIGPSVSAGVVSGLQREFRTPQGKANLSNLIQFDAAANPGNSGGPLVTTDGHVVGIVTAILNPSEQRTFIGIGFAVPIESAAQAAGTPPF